MEQLNAYSPILQTLGFLVMVIFIFLNNKRLGKDQSSEKVYELYKEQIALQETKINTQKAEITDLREQLKSFEVQLAALQAVQADKDTRIKELSDIVLNRNPELVQVLNEIRDFMKSMNKKLDVNQQFNDDSKK